MGNVCLGINDGGQPLLSVEEKLQAAEAALQDARSDNKTRDLVGHIAAIRAMLAIPQHQGETMIVQSRRALEYLHSDNLSVRTSATWTLGLGYQFQRDYARASRAYTEVIATAQRSGNLMLTIGATTCLGQVQEAENQLTLAAETYRQGLQLAGDPPLPMVCEMYLGLARVLYEWNNLDAAQEHGQQSLQLARQLVTVDTPAGCALLLARVKLARGDVAGAAALVEEADQFIRSQNFVSRMPEVAAAQVLILLHQGHLVAAARTAQANALPISQARIHLAQGDPSTALAVLSPWRQKVEAEGWKDEWLKVLILQAIALSAHGEKNKAVHLLIDALTEASPAGFIRLFVDEGALMAHLSSEVQATQMMPDYVGKLLAVFDAEKQRSAGASPLLPLPSLQPLIEPLSQREAQILQFIAQGLSNREIGERLFLALDTVKGHNRRIYDKLHVQRRTEAVARARELGLL